MLRFCEDNKGAISVFLTLILLPVLLFGGLTVDAARIYASKMVISDAGEMAMNAGLAQYADTLHDEYGLLVMGNTPEDMTSQLQEIFDRSLNGSSLPSGEDYDRILDLVTEGFAVISLKGSEIYQTEVEKQQIVEYMKYRAPVCMTELLLEKLNELKDTKAMSEAMVAQMEFGEAMEACHNSMEDAKLALDNLNSLIKSYPSQSEMDTELDRTQQDYTTRMARCLLMIAAISRYTEADERNDAEECVKSFIHASTGVDIGEYADSAESFNSYMNCLYYGYGETNAAKTWDDLLEEHQENEPDEDADEYEDWEERMDELNELDEAYSNAKSAIQGYPSRLRSIALDECITPHTLTVFGYWNLSNQGEEYARLAYEKLETVKKVLEDAQKKWENWSDKTAVLEELGKAGDMKASVDDYGEFFAYGDAATDASNLERLMVDVQTDKMYFTEIRDILTEEKFFEQSIATVENNHQYSTYLAKAGENVDADTKLHDAIESKRTSGYTANYVHTTITTAYVLEQIQDNPFYNRLIEYCSTSDTPESEAQKTEANKKLTASKTAGENAMSENGYPAYTWTMDENMPSVMLGLAAADDAKDGMAILDGNVNNKNGRKNAISKFKTSIQEATSFLDGLDRIVSDNLENLYVAEYAMQMFSYYTVDKKDGESVPEEEILSLSGYKLNQHKPYKAEVEYILWGNLSSSTNVRNTVMTIFGIRMLFNSFFAFTNHEIVYFAAESASAIAGMAPYLIPVIQVIIELAFAGLETDNDISKVKDGCGVTIIKTPDTWITFPTDRGRIGDNTKGVTLDYSEFLRIFLNINMLSGKDIKKLSRIADCIRLNTDFDLKNGYTMLAIDANIKARTTFMKTISDMNDGNWTESDNTYRIRYQSILGY